MTEPAAAQLLVHKMLRSCRASVDAEPAERPAKRACTDGHFAAGTAQHPAGAAERGTSPAWKAPLGLGRSALPPRRRRHTAGAAHAASEGGLLPPPPSAQPALSLPAQLPPANPEQHQQQAQVQAQALAHLPAEPDASSTRPATSSTSSQKAQAGQGSLLAGIPLHERVPLCRDEDEADSRPDDRWMRASLAARRRLAVVHAPTRPSPQQQAGELRRAAVNAPPHYPAQLQPGGWLRQAAAGPPLPPQLPRRQQQRLWPGVQQEAQQWEPARQEAQQAQHELQQAQWAQQRHWARQGQQFQHGRLRELRMALDPQHVQLPAQPQPPPRRQQQQAHPGRHAGQWPRPMPMPVPWQQQQAHRGRHAGQRRLPVPEYSEGDSGFEVQHAPEWEDSQWTLLSEETLSQETLSQETPVTSWSGGSTAQQLQLPASRLR